MTDGYRSKCLGLCAVRRGRRADPAELVGGLQESAESPPGRGAVSQQHHPGAPDRDVALGLVFPGVSRSPAHRVVSPVAEPRGRRALAAAVPAFQAVVFQACKRGLEPLFG